MARGVFGLNKVYKRQYQNIKDDNFESWPESATYGYFGGGFTPAIQSTIDRLDFSNETTSVPGNNLPEARYYLAAVSSSSYGYFGGGFTPPHRDTVDRIDFSNETTSLPGNDLSQARIALAAVSNSSYGYFGGGETSSTRVTTVERLDFSNETLSLPGNNLSQPRVDMEGTSNNSYGYLIGGFIPPSDTYSYTRIENLDFSNEVVSLPGNNLPAGRRRAAALSN